jgi:hypothetical protein
MTPLFHKSALFAAAAAILALFPCTASAQAKYKVSADKPKFDDLQSPQFSGTKNKSFTPKDWLEVETEIQVQMAPTPKTKTCDRLTIKWYVAVDNPEKSGTYLKFTKEIEHVNIPLDEKVYCSVYLSPSSIRRLTGSDRAGKGAVKAVGFEILVDGQVAAAESSSGGKWWSDAKAAAKFSDSEVVPLLSKAETPFAAMWWDRYAEEKSLAAGAR